MSTVTAPSRTREDLITDIRDMYAKLDREVPTGLSRMRKADLVNLQAHMLDMYATAQEMDVRNTAGLTPADWATQGDDVVPLHEQPMADSPAAVAQAEEDDIVMLGAQDSLRPLFSHAGRRPTASQRAHRRTRNRMQRVSRRRNRR